MYPGRIGITTPSCHEPEVRLEATLGLRAAPDQKSVSAQTATRLKQEYFTLAEALKESGYATGHFGKWHLGLEPYDPKHQGFDVDVPNWSGPGPSGYLAPWKVKNFNLPAQDGENVEDLMSQEAIKFIREHKDEPFYLNYWAFSVHSPWQAKPALVEKYRRKSDPKALQRDPVYAAMVESLDDAVGRLLNTLDELKIAERTIIVFFSDNGGVNWFEPNMKKNSGMDYAPTDNAPLRGGKGTLYEGGTREPCVVVWPGKAQAGAKSDALLNSVDFYPTLLEMAGVAVKPEVKPDGVSQVPALMSKKGPRDTTFCYFPHYTPPGHIVKTVPGAWVRQGDWKLIRLFNDAPDQSDRYELYNLKDDPGEVRDLSVDQYGKVQELDVLLSKHLRETNVLVPGKNPYYNAELPDLIPVKGATLAKRNGVLVITAEGNPSFNTTELPPGQGPFTLGVRIRAHGKGEGRVYWNTSKKEPYARERSSSFPLQHDDAWHNYVIQIPSGKPLYSLRLDTGIGAGEPRIEFLRLRDKGEKLVREWSFNGDDYVTGPDSRKQPEVPVGKRFQFTFDSSRIFPGTSRGITVHVPAQYKADKPACVYVGLDGLGYGVPEVFDNLIHSGEMPVTIAIGVSPGSVASTKAGQNPRFNRSFEFDGLNDNLARFILEELLPDIEKRQTPDGLPIRLSKDPNDRCTGGGSTGGIGAFTLAWERPDAFRRVFSSVGTYVGMRGGDGYPVVVRKTEPKPIRIFMQDGEHDQWMGGPEVGDWWMSNQTMERALKFSGYQVEHVWGTGRHSGKQASMLFPDAMRWLWKGWPQPVTSGTSDNKVLQSILLKGEEWKPVANVMSPGGALATDAQGNVAFVNTKEGKLMRVSAEGAVSEIGSVKAEVTSFAFGADGRMILADTNAKKLMTRGGDGKEGVLAEGVSATGFVATHDGRIYATDAKVGTLTLIKPDGTKVELDRGLRQPAAVTLSPDGLWLAVAEASTPWGVSYRVQEDGTVQEKQRYYWYHIPDWAEDSGAKQAVMDAAGQMYVATRMGLEVFDRNGRVRAILPLPNRSEVSAIAFGGKDFKTLYVIAGGKLWARQMKLAGVPAWSAPMQLPPWGAG
jgi:arylsulfatase A-like enzyme/sugar lactone lactonase YvrE/enterochelin esterase-like enzyme